MFNLFFTLALYLFQATDTLTKTYSEKWEGVQSGAGPSVLESNELIYIVLGVSLIIWFVLLAYLFRIEKQLKTMESKNQ